METAADNTDTLLPGLRGRLRVRRESILGTACFVRTPPEPLHTIPPIRLDKCAKLHLLVHRLVVC
jgi:hypothetical protein